jgi:ATP-binding cassette subfamily B protein
VISVLKKLIKNSKWILGQAKSSIPPLLLLTFMGVASSLTSVFIALSTKKLFDSAQNGQINLLMQSGLSIICIVLLQSVLQLVMTIYSTKVSVSLSNRIRLRLFEKLFRSQWLDFTKYHSGDLLTRMTSDVETVTSGVASVIPEIIALFFNLCASLVVLFIFDPLLAIFAFILGPISVVLMRLFSRKLKEYHLRIQETESTLRGFVQERLNHMHIIKSFGLEGDSSDVLSGLQNKKLGWVIKRSKLSAVSSAVLTLSYWLGFMLAILWGSVRLSQGTATFGTITVFLQLVGQIQGPFISLTYSLPQIIIMYASAGRLMDLYAIEDECLTGKAPDWSAAGVCSENLEFRYDKDTAVLDNVSFNIRPCEFTAVVGASGEGKTTFIRLLLALLKPSGGGLYYYNPETLDKVNAGTVTRSLASYVPQGNTLFSGTIRENVLLGNKAANTEELADALKKACIWDFVDSLPEKLDTLVGENGYGLSEGQAQRISIARALLSRKPVLILDEATSALDAETELEVLSGIASIKPRPTCIIITHRQAALDFCSRVLTIENGTVSETQTFS